jgi:hypothetical protein
VLGPPRERAACAALFFAHGCNRVRAVNGDWDCVYDLRARCAQICGIEASAGMGIVNDSNKLSHIVSDSSSPSPLTPPLPWLPPPAVSLDEVERISIFDLGRHQGEGYLGVRRKPCWFECGQEADASLRRAVWLLAKNSMEKKRPEEIGPRAQSRNGFPPRKRRGGDRPPVSIPWRHPTPSVGEVGLEALRDAKGPVTVRELADAMLAAKRITEATAKQHAMEKPSNGSGKVHLCAGG